MLASKFEEPLLSRVAAHGCTLVDLAHALDEWGEVSIWEHCSAQAKPSSPPFHQPGRYHYLALGEHRSLRIQSNIVYEVSFESSAGEEKSSPLEQFENDPFVAIEAFLSQYKNRISPQLLGDKLKCELPPFIGGLIGFIGYDNARFLEHIPAISEHAIEPDVYLRAIANLIVLDKKENEFIVITWPRSDDRTSSSENRERNIRLTKAVESATPHFNKQANSGIDISSSDRPGLSDDDFQVPYSCKYDSDAFVQRVTKAKDYIRAGDIFQVVLSNELSIPQSVDPLKLYSALTQINPSPYHYCFSFEKLSLVGASPEVMLRANSPDPTSRLHMRLVAGTYPRGLRADEEKLRIQALQEDQKENAEHIMLVDHCRNDIGRMAEIGSVQVSDLCSVEPYLDVYHLVSQVSGCLREDRSTIDALRAAFPIATLTGTPKIRAMEIISELETPSRGSFGGALVLLGPDGFIDSAVIIRTALLTEDKAIVRAGAGIVHDSIPEREYQECLWKARALLHAISTSTESDDDTNH